MIEKNVKTDFSAGFSPMMGQATEVRFRDEVVGGVAVGLDEDGSLILRTDENKQLRVSAGDASIIKR